MTIRGAGSSIIDRALKPRRCLALFLALALSISGCGSDSGGEDGTTSITPPTTGGQTATSISTNVTQANPTITLAGQASVDFSTSPNIFGSQVTLAAQDDVALNGAASTFQSFLGTDFAGTNIIEVRLLIQPQADVRISITSAQLVARANANRVPMLYLMSVGLESTDDGEGGLISLAPVRTTRRTNGDLSAQIPFAAFEPDGSGRFVARIKAGLADIVVQRTSAAAEPVTSQQSAQAMAAEAPALQLPCPLALPRPRPAQGARNGITVQNESTAGLCIETSRFNPLRNIRVSRPHRGVDLRASPGTDVYIPSGGRPSASDSFTAKRFAALTSSSCAAPQPCTTQELAFGGAGITLVVTYDTFRLRLLHLNGIDASMLNGSGEIDETRTTNALSPVATTGGTGAGRKDPHLHYEVGFPAPLYCPEGVAETSCAQVWGPPVDPFPLIATDLRLRIEGGGRYGSAYLEPGAQYTFALFAFDLNGTEVRSQVGDAQENGGVPPAQGSNARYDPTRSFCLSSSASALRIGSSTGGRSGPAGSTCVNWGGNISATAVSYQPSADLLGRFSTDPTKQLASDPLSTATAQGSVVTPQNFCLSNPILLVFAGSSCPGFILAGCNSTEVNFITARSSNPAVAQARVVPVQDARPSFCDIIITAGGTAGDTVITFSYSRGSISAGPYNVRNLALR